MHLFLNKWTIDLFYDLTTYLLGIYPKELKTVVQTETCTWMFITALFAIPPKWKQPKCPWVDEWINKIRYTVEYYSSIENNEVLLNTTT